MVTLSTTQLLKTAQCEYMEDELWEFMEKNVHPILLSSREGKGSDAHVASSCTRDGLQDYIKELFTSLRNATIDEVTILAVNSS